MVLSDNKGYAVMLLLYIHKQSILSQRKCKFICSEPFNMHELFLLLHILIKFPHLL